jgi:hypothetical protein
MEEDQNDLKSSLRLMMTLLGSEEGVYCLTLMHAVVQPQEKLVNDRHRISSFKELNQ